MKTLYLSGVVGYEIRPEKVREFLSEGSKETVQVIVNSPGGYVDDAFEIYNLFSQYKGKVEFIISGMAMSAMSYIIMSGDKITAFKNSIFMSHKVWGMTVGNSDEILKEAEIMNGMDNIIAESYMERFGKTKKQILSDMKDEIWILGWEDLLSYGIIDDVIDKPEDLEINVDDVDNDNIDITGDLNSLDKSQARVTLMQTFNKMKKDEDRSKKSLKKVAKYIEKESNQVIPEDNKLNEGDNKMSLKDFLKTNPQAQADHDEALKSAKAEGYEEAKKAFSKTEVSNENVAKILNASGINVTEKMASALDGKTTVEDYALSVLADERKSQGEGQKEGFFGSIASKQIPKDSATDDAEDEEYAKKAKDRAEKIAGGKK